MNRPTVHTSNKQAGKVTYISAAHLVLTLIISCVIYFLSYLVTSMGFGTFCIVIGAVVKYATWYEKCVENIASIIPNRSDRH